MKTILTDNGRVSASIVSPLSLPKAWPNLHRRLPPSYIGAYVIRKGSRNNGSFLGICVTTNNAVLSCSNPRCPELVPHRTLREAAGHLLECI